MLRNWHHGGHDLWVVQGRMGCVWWKVVWVGGVWVWQRHMHRYGMAVVLGVMGEVLRVLGGRKVCCWRRKGVGTMVDDRESRRLENGGDRSVFSFERNVRGCGSAIRKFMDLVRGGRRQG